jgi:phosphohistidine swiveling domain-containing protein/predicted DNA-binding protein YlxM (UPF0122 family)
MEEVLQKYNLKSKDWHYYGQWEQPPLSDSFWMMWYDKDTARKLDIECSGGFMMLNGHTLVLKEDFEYFKEISNKAWDERDEEFFSNTYSVFTQLFEDHKKIVSELENYQEGNFELFEKFVSSASKVMLPWIVGVFYSDCFEDKLIPVAKKHGVSLQKVLDAIPKKQTLMIDEYHEALEIKHELEKKGLLGMDNIQKDEVWEKIQNHVKKHEWIGTHHLWGDPMTVDKFLNDVQTLPEISEPKVVDLPEELGFMVKIGGDLSFLRQYSAEVFSYVAYKARALLNDIARHFGLSYNQLLYLTTTEIQDHLKNKTTPSTAVIIRRMKNKCVFRTSFDQDFVIVDNQEELKDFFTSFVPEQDLDVSEFSGTIANIGKAIGKAKIFLVPKNFDKMKIGDILVTPMTTPDFIPLMQKAAAIVTDTGGLLSHASIVSREMGKPCIIGTKIATKVLKDGDLVEVDAQNGVVKKI